MFNKKTPAVKKAALKRNGGGEANSGFQGANCRGKGKGKTAERLIETLSTMMLDAALWHPTYVINGLAIQ